MEEERVNNPNCNDEVKIQHICKIYNNKVKAIKDLSLGIRKGECFGLLGLNGAGKTTLLKILTQTHKATIGECYINNNKIDKNSKRSVHCNGYCPENNNIIPFLTVKQHLYFYCKIKGIDKNIINGYVEELLNVFHLKEYEKQDGGKLSGGIKRILCIAISLIGNPSLLILDEATAGLDPENRRYLWKLINFMCKKERSTTVLLSTQSLEEAEALCDRISIVVKGELKCIGRLEHIKSKFGKCYKIDIKMSEATIDESGYYIELLKNVKEVSLEKIKVVCELLNDMDLMDRIKNESKGIYRNLNEKGHISSIYIIYVILL